MTTSIETTHKIIGLAAAGASMLGMRLDDALRLDPGQLEQHIAKIRQMPASPALPAAAPTSPATPPTPEDPSAFATSHRHEPADISILGSIFQH